LRKWLRLFHSSKEEAGQQESNIMSENENAPGESQKFEPGRAERTGLEKFLRETEQMLRFILWRRADLGLDPVMDRTLVAAWLDVVEANRIVKAEIRAASYKSLEKVGMTGAQWHLKREAFNEAMQLFRERLKKLGPQFVQEFENCAHETSDDRMLAGEHSTMILTPEGETEKKRRFALEDEAAGEGKKKDKTQEIPKAETETGLLASARRLLKSALGKLLPPTLNVLSHVNAILDSLKAVSSAVEILKEFKDCVENLIETRRVANEP
jgi:hypothetical protein